MSLYTEPSSLFLGFLHSAGLNLKTLLLVRAGITGMNDTFPSKPDTMINQALWFILPLHHGKSSLSTPFQVPVLIPSRLLRIARVCV